MFGRAFVFACMLTLCLPLAVHVPAFAVPVWDPGPGIAGDLDDSVIEVAASSEDGDSTGTIGWSGSDTDEWVDPDESTPTSGNDIDDWGGWEQMKCWWTTTAGSVSQYQFTTTWTAPFEEGTEANVEIGVVNLPKSIRALETGSRNDPRKYSGRATPNATAYWVTYHINTSGPTHGSPQFDFGDFSPPSFGDGNTLGIVDPTWDDCNGFFKKVELVGVVTPAKSGKTFRQYQWCMGYEKLNGATVSSDDWWVSDGPNGASQDTSDGSAKIYMWDAPGMHYSPDPWSKNADWLSNENGFSFSDCATFRGSRCSAYFRWWRRLKVSGPNGWDTWTTIDENL